MEQACENTCDFCFKKANWLVHAYKNKKNAIKICSGVSQCHTKAVECAGFYYWSELIKQI